MRVPMMLFSIERANNINRHFIWIGRRLDSIFSNYKYSLLQANVKISSEKYLTAAFFSALIYGLLFFGLLYALLFVRDMGITAENSLLAFAIGFLFFCIFFVLHMIYPSLMAKKYAAGIDQNLLFALKSILIQVSSGVSLFDAIANVGKGDYGIVSKEFKDLAKKISAGESESKALEKMALETKSEYLKKTTWQLLTSLRSGASLQGSLKSIVETLSSNQARAIKNYAAELNLWILVYLLLAAAVPTLGVTFLVILSSLGGAAIGPDFIILIIFGAFAMQIVLIGFVKNRIPKVFN